MNIILRSPPLGPPLLHTSTFPHPFLPQVCDLSEACGAFHPLLPCTRVRASVCVYIYPCFLSPKFQGPFFCFCNLLPEPLQPSWLTSSTSVTLYITFCLYLSLGSESFLNQTLSTEFDEPRVQPPVTFWCHFAANIIR